MTNDSECSIPRFARVKDAPAVFDVLWSCSLEIPLPASYDLQQVRGECRSKQYWVVESEDAIVGAMKLCVNDIFFLAVRAEYRKQGIARSLISFAKNRCTMRRWSSLSAKTRKDNAPTIALLESEGFLQNPVALVLDSGWIAYAWNHPIGG
jgi:ribosomal protein S18 acetylase RimI-like enzyme